MTTTTTITNEQLSAIVSVAVTSAMQAMGIVIEPAPAPRVKSAKKQTPKRAAKLTAKPKPKRAKGEVRHIEVKANVKGMATRAIGKAKAAHGMEFKLETMESYCVTKAGECHWAWLRNTDGKLNHDNGPTVAATMGANYKYSPRRNAIRREYDYDIRKNH